MEWRNVEISDFINTQSQNTIFETVGIGVLIFVLIYIPRTIIANRIHKTGMKIAKQSGSNTVEAVVKSYDRPIRKALSYFAIYAGFMYVVSTDIFVFLNGEFIEHVFKTGILVQLMIGTIKLLSEESGIYEDAKIRYKTLNNSLIIPFLAKVLKAVTIVFIVIGILDIWGINMQGVLAGIGIIGVAISLAAQDTASSMIAGTAIIIEQPFKIGDWIMVGDNEGIVQDVSLRTTKIRTFDQELVTIPNSHIADASIYNFSERGRRRVKFHLGVTYSSTQAQLKSAVERLRSMLQQHPKVDNDIYINFEDFNDSSLDILVMYYTEAVDLESYLKVKEEINFSIMTILEEEGLSCAFPSQSIYFETPIKSENGETKINEIKAKDEIVQGELDKV